MATAQTKPFFSRVTSFSRTSKLPSKLLSSHALEPCPGPCRGPPAEFSWTSRALAEAEPRPYLAPRSQPRPAPQGTLVGASPSNRGRHVQHLHRRSLTAPTYDLETH